MKDITEKELAFRREFGAYVKEARERIYPRVSQLRFAQMCGFEVAARLINIEAGRCDVTVKEAMRIGDALGTPFEYRFKNKVKINQK
jgi:hypothetical protein